MIETEITAYYAKRACEYDRIYLKPERQANLKQLRTTVTNTFSGLDLLEIACGTGYWTQIASSSAKSIVATDLNDEVLSIARMKKYGSCPVTFIKDDAYVLNEVNGLFSGAMACFWWSHVPVSKLDDFLQVLHSKLTDGAIVLMLDNRYVEGNSTDINRTDDDGNTYQIRKLSDGSEYEVLKNFPTKDEFNKRIKSFTDESIFIIMDYFWFACYRYSGDQSGI